MGLNLSKPITYLITSGETTATTTSSTEDFARLLNHVSAAVAARVNLIQLREKNLNARVLYALVTQAAALTRGSSTLLLVNDRADIAQAAGADGVHLTASSLEAAVVRNTFAPDFVIGVSTHSLSEACAARDGGADFAVFGPVFETATKLTYGEPVGLRKLAAAAHELSPFPIIALGGIALTNAEDCMRAGASGIAGISLFNRPSDLHEIVRFIHEEAAV